MARPGVLVSLSAAEQDTLELVAEGLSNEAIAARLRLSVKTVEARCRSVFRKVGVAANSSVSPRVAAASLYWDAMAFPGRLPVVASTFVGRDGLVDELRGRVRPGAVVTLCGPGGIGKSRAALAFAAQAGPPVPRWVDLVPAHSSDEATAALLDAFGISGTSSEIGMRRLARRLSAEPALVVVDNAEHLRADVRRLVELVRSFGAIVLVTSRMPLGVDGEEVLSVGPLAIADACTVLADRLHDHGADGDDVNLDRAVLEAVCDRVDGMPLALELVAARLARLGPAAILDGLEDLPGLLRGSGVGRHSGLVATLASSVDGLSGDVQDCFARLSVFPSGFTLEQAQAVALCGVDGVEELVSVSLVSRRGDRFRMLEPVRQYAAVELDRRGIRDDTEGALVRWCVELAGASAWGFWERPEHESKRLADEAGTIDAAVSIAVRRGDARAALRLVSGFGAYWGLTRPDAGLRRAELALTLAQYGPRSRLWAWASVAAGANASFLRQATEAASYLEASIEVFTAVDDRLGELVARFWLGRLTKDRREMQQAVNLADELGVGVLRIWARAIDADTLVDLGRYDEAEEAISKCRQIAADGTPAPPGIIDHTQGCLLFHQSRDLDRAAVLFETAARSFDESGDRWNVIQAVAYRVFVALRQGHMDRAMELTDQELALAEDFAEPVTIGHVCNVAAMVAWHATYRGQAVALSVHAGRLIKDPRDRDISVMVELTRPHMGADAGSDGSWVSMVELAEFSDSNAPGVTVDEAAVIAEARGLLGEIDARRQLLATVMFSDLVDSTGQLAQLGDRAWRRRLDQHQATSLAALVRYDGTHVKWTGDGLVAYFDTPAQALRCAVNLRDELEAIGLRSRTGLHTGRIERRGSDIAGITVHIAARVQSVATPGDVLVSRTVKDLVAGGDIEFDDRGVHHLKGVPDPWQLLAVTRSVPAQRAPKRTGTK